jgi:hypothetical protein
MDRECLYPGHPDTCTPWHYLELDGGRRIVTRVLVKAWTHRHPEITSGDLAVLLILAAHTGPDTTVSLDYEALATKTGPDPARRDKEEEPSLAGVRGQDRVSR